jgi:peptidoglycan hydrolase-like protein with peptidoglycan-binding domain
MKKRTLKEEIERIHSITYGKKVLLEDDLLTKLMQGGDSSNVKPIDDPAKADFVDDNVRKFLNDLKDIDHEVSEHKFGEMEYQKEVELVQIALVLLGYDLPVHGIDGYFGPETGAAVKKYKADNNIVSESSSPYKGGGNITVNSDIDNDIDDRLQSKIEAIASEYDKPFRIKSGYRDPKRNSIVHGAENSAHLRHNAVDVGLQDDSIESTLKFVAIASKNGIGGIGVYGPGSVHIDLEGRRSWGPTFKRGSVPSWAESTIQDHLNSKIDTGYVPNFDSNTDGGDQSLSNEMETVSPDMIKSMSSKLELKGVTKEQLDQLVDKITSGGGEIFTDLDLSTDEGYKMYVNICEAFIRTRTPNPLGITGTMLADGAKMAFTRFNKYVPPELACGQLAAEGGIGDPNTNNIPVTTKNPFDVANTETGTKTYPTVQAAIDGYYSLIARRYLGKGKTSNDLLNDFVNHENQRYAGSAKYEGVVKSIAKQVRKIAQKLENNV